MKQWQSATQWQRSERGKVVQRVDGQSVISSTLNTTINGGSFKDNLTNALLSNIGNQINAEGAGLIGDNGEILDLPDRALSHAVVAGISAELLMVRLAYVQLFLKKR
ncbi:DUF637 domain-containing protein [Klebsiella sp. RHBSTW-00215]|uniref:DUF637 domain-containing protein n=1 Tax=Klebsiella sp. RHBSTW-00215 TaxID=2742640 RepID=UPI0015F5184D|nr:DUF637 domain-containing protein [Klebsiella sp. RHBSTW-00215]MBA7934086.1 DUF637 domain-containing protein [Klebsiella sp. RHBSTW-00215]